MPREAPSLAEILADARVWKLKDASAAPARPVWSTGKSALDARLPGGGWPTASLIEVLLDDTGLGEVQLFLPALVECQRRRAAAASMMLPGSSGLHRRMNRMPLPWRSKESSWDGLLVVRPASATEALWAAEQALSSGVCAAVFLWLKGTDDRWLRRLKLAAEAGGALGVLFRPERHRFESSPASCDVDDARASMSRVSICSRCKAAGRALSILVALEIADCEIARRQICLPRAAHRRAPRPCQRRAPMSMPAVSMPAVPCPRFRAATAQTSGRTRTHQLWYAAVFPEFG